MAHQQTRNVQSADFEPLLRLPAIQQSFFWGDLSMCIQTVSKTFPDSIGSVLIDKKLKAEQLSRDAKTDWKAGWHSGRAAAFGEIRELFKK